MTAIPLLASCRIADQPASPLPGMALAVQTTQLLLSLGCAAPWMSFGLSCTESRTRIDGKAFCKPRGAGERKGKGLWPAQCMLPAVICNRRMDYEALFPLRE